MKKHIKRFVSHRRYASWRKRKKLQMPLAFASLFAVIMVVYGISLIFAATPTEFSLTPATQTVTPNQTKTVKVHFDPKGNNVRGGSVKVTFDPNRLTFNTATPASNTYPYYITSGSAGSGSYTFNFATYTTTKQAIDFGTLSFTIKAATGTVNTNLAFTTASTYGYYPSSSSHLSSTYVGATMTIQGTPVVTKPTVSVSLNPASVAYNGSTTVSWTAANSPTSCSNNFGGTATASGSLKINNLTAARTFTVTCTNTAGSGSDSKVVAVAAKPGDPPPPITITGDNPPPASDDLLGTSPDGVPPDLSSAEGENGLPYEDGLPDDLNLGPDQNALQPSVPENTNAKKKSSPVAILLVIAGLATLGASGYMYFVRLKPKSRLPKAKSLKSGLFDADTKGTTMAVGSLFAKQKQSDKKPAEAPEPTEEVEVVIPHEGSKPKAHSQPPVPPKSEEALKPEPVKSPAPPEPQELPKSRQVTETPEPPEPPAPPVPRTEEVPTSEKPVQPTTQPLEAVNIPAPPVQAATQPVEPPGVAEPPKPPQQLSGPQLSPADQIAQAALADLAAHKPTPFQEVVANAGANGMPKPPEPQWQKTVAHKKPPKDEPKDMFELAEEDPENFGSAQLAESYGEDLEKHETPKQ